MTLTVGEYDLDTIAKWTREKEVTTSRGPRFLSTAKVPPGHEFWTAWANHKAAMQAVGISVSKDKFSDEWVACRWRELPQEELDRRARSVEQSRATDADIDIPCNEGCVPMPFQKAGVKILIERENNLLADSMGLGKTCQTLMLINCVESIHRVLIICPAGLKNNWYDEAKKWLVRPMSIGIADSKCFPTTDVVIINFDITHKFVKRMEFFWDLVIVDEAHRIKNPNARRSRSIVGYKPKRAEAAAGMLPTSGIPAKRKLLLTGTPFENKPAELYPLLRYLLGDRMMSKGAFEKKYCGAGMTGFGWQANGASDLEGLNNWLRSEVMIRRLKKDVLRELPPKTRVVIELDATGLGGALQNEKATMDKYETGLVRAQVEFELVKCLDDDKEYEERYSALKREFRVPFDEIAKVRHETALAKLPMVFDEIEADMEEVGRKIVVFAAHQDILEKLHARFPGSVVVHGTNPKPGPNQLAERHALVRRFQTEPDCGPFFGSIKTCGEGITLTAASLCGFAEEDWVPGKISQCEDRLHRIGQKDNVLAKHWVLKGSYDAKMITTNIRKQEVFDCALDDLKQEMMTEPVLVPRHEPLATRKEIRIESSIVDEKQRAECLAAVRDFIVEMADDEEVGEVDMAIAKELAARESLTAKEAVLARKVCIRYKKQFSRSLEKCGGWQGTKL